MPLSGRQNGNGRGWRDGSIVSWCTALGPGHLHRSNGLGVGDVVVRNILGFLCRADPLHLAAQGQGEGDLAMREVAYCQLKQDWDCDQQKPCLGPDSMYVSKYADGSVSLLIHTDDGVGIIDLSPSSVAALVAFLGSHNDA